jgi:homoserine O-succinyltransferase
MKRIAVISMGEGWPSAGLEAVKALAQTHGEMVCMQDIRIGDPVPALDSFDILLSTGGPGDPTDLGQWGEAYAALINGILEHNRQNQASPKKAFLICHSFQVMSYYWGLGEISKRDGALWGAVPQKPQKTTDDVMRVFPAGDFHALESRFYQVMPTLMCEQICRDKDLVIVAKDDRGAITAWQTRDGHMAATQFHPEGTPKDVINLIDNRPESEIYTINHCAPEMIDYTRQHVNDLTGMNVMLADFVKDAV